MRLIGDIPIYVAPGGADHRAHPELFQRGRRRRRRRPTRCSATGQLWGNPLYDWHAHAARRATAGGSSGFRRTFELVDLARIDHFRGFVAVLGGPGAATGPRATAAGGAGPGASSSTRSRRELGELPLVAEDLGVITPAVDRLRDELGLPGMVVHAVRAFDGGRARTRTGSRTTASTQVVYAGTHDNDTARRLVTRALPPRARRDGDRLDPREPSWELIELRSGSRADAGDRAGAGRARPRHRGADEHARDERGQLARGGSGAGSSPTGTRRGCAR